MSDCVCVCVCVFSDCRRLQHSHPLSAATAVSCQCRRAAAEDVQGGGPESTFNSPGSGRGGWKWDCGGGGVGYQNIRIAFGTREKGPWEWAQGVGLEVRRSPERACSSALFLLCVHYQLGGKHSLFIYIYIFFFSFLFWEACKGGACLGVKVRTEACSCLHRCDTQPLNPLCSGHLPA